VTESTDAKRLDQSEPDDDDTIPASRELGRVGRFGGSTSVVESSTAGIQAERAGGMRTRQPIDRLGHTAEGVSLPAANDVIDGRFRIVRRRPEPAGMSALFDAITVAGQAGGPPRDVVIKFLLDVPGDAELTGSREHPLPGHEAETAKALADHPSVVRVIDSGVYRELPYIVFERLFGRSLAARLHEYGPLSVSETVLVGRHLLSALALMHRQGHAHRDVKPGNVWCSEDGGVKLLDFGIAMPTPSNRGDAGLLPPARAEDLVSLGTPGFAAPEHGQADADERADLFSVGVVLYMCLTGDVPFGRAWLDSAVPQVAAPLSDESAAARNLTHCIERALQWRPGDRFASADEMMEALNLVGPGSSPLSRPCPWVEYAPYDERDAHLFFGREDTTIELVRGLQSGHRLIPVVGACGAGKSSVVHAGAIAHLRRDGRPWTVLRMRAGRWPLSELARAIDETLPNLAPEFRRALKSGARASELAELLIAKAEAVGTPFLLVIDQFEELYVLAEPNRRAAFMDVLMLLIDSAVSWQAIVAMRYEHLAAPMNDARFRQAAGPNMVFVAKPSRNQLAQMLVQPAASLGLEFDDRLADVIADALFHDKVVAPLPLLAAVATRIWERIDRGTGRIEDEEIRNLSDVERLYAEHADAKFETLPTDRAKGIAKLVFLSLVTTDRRANQLLPSEIAARFFGRGLPDSPDPQPVGDDELRSVLKSLDAARLIISTQTGHVRLVHESLITHWDRLSGWLNGEAAIVAGWVGFVESSAASFRSKRGALLTGKQLEQLKPMRDRVDSQASPSALAYLEQSGAAAFRRRVTIAAAATVAVALGGLALNYGREQSQTVEQERKKRVATERRERYASIRSAAAKPNATILAASLRRAAFRPTSGWYQWAVRGVDEIARGQRRARLSGHTDIIKHVTFVPGSALVTTCSADYAASVHNLLDGSEPLSLPHRYSQSEHEGFALRATSSTGARQIVVGYRSGLVRAWNLDGSFRDLMTHAKAPVQALAMTLDGTRIVSAAANGELCATGSSDGKSACVSLGADNVTDVSFAGDGYEVVFGTRQGRVGLWRSGEEGIESSLRLESGIVSIRSASGARFAAAATRSGRLFVIERQKEWNARAIETDGLVAAVAVRSCEGRELVYALVCSRNMKSGELGHAKCHVDKESTWNLKGFERQSGSWNAIHNPLQSYRRTARCSDGRPLSSATRPRQSRVLPASLDGAGRWFATATGKHSIDVFMVGRSFPRVEFGEQGNPPKVAARFADRGRTVITADASGMVSSWSRNSERAPKTLGKHAAAAVSLQLSNDGSRALTAGDDGTARLWALDRGVEEARYAIGAGNVEGAEFSNDDRQIVTSGGGNTAHVFAIGGSTHSKLRHDGDVRHAVFIGSDRILTGSADKKLRFWRRDKIWRETRAVEFDGWVRHIVHSPQAAGFAVAVDQHDQSGNVARAPLPDAVWFTEPGALSRFKFAWHGSETVHVSSAPIGTLLATVAHRPDRNAALWSPDNGLLCALNGHSSRVWKSAFAPNGTLVATASDDKTARIWPTHCVNGEATSTILAGHKDHVRDVAFSPKGASVLTASLDGTARSWPTKPSGLHKRLFALAPACPQRREWLSALGGIDRAYAERLHLQCHVDLAAWARDPRHCPAISLGLASGLPVGAALQLTTKCVVNAVRGRRPAR